MNLLSFEIQEDSASLTNFKYSLIVEWHYKIPIYNKSREIDCEYRIETLENIYFDCKDSAIKVKNELIMKAHTMGFEVMDKGETKK